MTKLKAAHVAALSIMTLLSGYGITQQDIDACRHDVSRICRGLSEDRAGAMDCLGRMQASRAHLRKSCVDALARHGA